MYYGTRFLKVKDFLSYCDKLNIRTSEKELEFYEQHGMMLPRARIIRPDELERRIFRWDTQHIEFGEYPSEWDALKRLEENPIKLQNYWINLRDEELVHPIDREKGNNAYLTIPNHHSSRPWKEYRTAVTYPDGTGSHRSTADHFYSYWQCHQLFELQKDPLIYKYRRLVLLSSDEQLKEFCSSPFNHPERYRTFNGLETQYDALSFFIHVSHNERERTLFSFGKDDHGILTLSDVESKNYKNRLAQIGKMVLQRYEMAEPDIIKFISKLLDLRWKYLEIEKIKLASHLEDDIFKLANWFMAVTGSRWNQVAEDILSVSTYYHQRQFLSLDYESGAFDHMEEELLFYVRHYNTEIKKHLSENSARIIFVPEEVRSLRRFCEAENFDLLSHFINEIEDYGSYDDVSDNERERKSRPINRYSTLKSLATAFEYFLRIIMQKYNIGKNQKYMTRLVDEFLLLRGDNNLYSGFHSRIQDGRVKSEGNNPEEFHAKLKAILDDPDLSTSENGFWIKQFLISCLTRNLTVHSYPQATWFYGDYMLTMREAIIYSIMYSWHQTPNGLIQSATKTIIT